MKHHNGEITQFIVKIASRCNLNCSYCYVYNKADSTWKQRPPLMSRQVFSAALMRIRQHCVATHQTQANIVFHGGEPCLAGARQVDTWCAEAEELLDGIADLHFYIQTNGTLLDKAWADVFNRHRIGVGISMDGPRNVHDQFRVDHKGHGSYDRILTGIEILRANNTPFSLLSVIPLGADPLAVHRHFTAMGSTGITYVLPHYTHDTIAPVHRIYGQTPCADFLIPVFDDWWFNSSADFDIGDLRNVARIVLGGKSRIETLGNIPPLYVFIETDGEMEGLDNLRACGEGMAKIYLNVLEDEIAQIRHTNTMHGMAIYEGLPLPQGCRNCPERDTCSGGYLPHRYSELRGFDNPSVWCADLLKLFTHVRMRMGVTVAETRERREQLSQLALTGCPS